MMFTSVLRVSAVAATLGFAGAANAAPLIGSIAVGGASVTTSGSIAALNLFAPAGATAGLSTGSFASAGSWSGSLMSMSASALQATSPVNLTMSASGFGTFIASSFNVVHQSENSLDVMFAGSFDPQFGAGAFSSGQSATLRLDVSRTGAVASLTGILALSTSDTGSANGTGDTNVPGSGSTTGGGSTGGGSTGGGSTGGVTVTAVPEPASMALLGAGLLGVGLLHRRRN